MADTTVSIDAIVDLEGCRTLAQMRADGENWLKVETILEGVVACHGCGSVAEPKERPEVTVRDVPAFGVPTVIVFAKRRWRCPARECGVKTWTEAIGHVRPKAVLTERARYWAFLRVASEQHTVAQVARDLGVTWWTAHDAFVEHADRVLTAQDRRDAVAPTDDEDRDDEPEVSEATEPEHEPEGEAIVEDEPDAGEDEGCGAGGGDADAGGADSFRDLAGDSDTAWAQAWADVAKLGVDENAYMSATPETPTGFLTAIVDLTGPKARIIDICDGRNANVAQAWLDHRPGTWLDQIKAVAIDASASYRRGLLDGGLRGANMVLDPFHLAKLANDAVDDVRRRVQRETGRTRDKADDPLYKCRKLLRCRYDRLPAESRERLRAAFAHGDPYGELEAAWAAKNLLADVIDARDERSARKALFEFHTFCVDLDIAEVDRLAATVGRWDTEIMNRWQPDSYISNGPTEAMNLNIDNLRRNARGFRNFANYRRRLLLSHGQHWKSHETKRLRTRKPRLIA